MSELGVTAALNINDLPFAADRTRAWRELREAGEAVSSGDEIILTSAEAVEFAAKRPEIFSSARAFDRLGSPVPLVPIAIDPPDHTRFRRMLDPFFSPKKMAERESELRRQAGELIDAIVARGECDVVTDLATPFPSQVFLTLFGLPLADRDRLVQWKDAILQFTDPGATEATPEVMAHALELFTYLTEHIAERRANSTGSDMLTQLIQDTEEGGMSDNEILGLCFLFVLAGLDTVTSAVGFSLARLATDAEMRHRIANDLSLIPAFIEDILRVDGPVPFAPRVTTEEVEVGGQGGAQGHHGHAQLRQRRPRSAAVPGRRRGSSRQQGRALRVRARTTPLSGFTSGASRTPTHPRGMAQPHTRIHSGFRQAATDAVAYRDDVAAIGAAEHQTVVAGSAALTVARRLTRLSG